MTIKVSGMSCAHCEKAVETAAKSVAGVVSASASAKAGSVTIEGDFDLAAVVAAIEAEGYEVD